jgi:type II secretory pathway pseudopilin PulG
MNRRLSALTLAAFTYVELMMAMGILMVLLALVSISIGPALGRSNTTELANTLISDLFSQQQKAMQGELSAGQLKPTGVYFAADRYVLFSGESYVASASDNITIELPDSEEFSLIQLPNQSIIFATGSGTVRNYDNDQSVVTLAPTTGGTARSLQVNRYGIIELY